MSEVRWVHVLTTGEEVNYSEQPDNVPTLCVTVVARRSGYAVEETTTHLIHMTDGEATTIVYPRGRHWRFNGTICGSARWVRKRPLKTNEEERA
jgi:hypothetical protein